MKRFFIPTLLGTLLVLAGCNKSTTGGPGADQPPPPQREVGKNENTFTLEAPATTTNLAQGESKRITIGIKRETNFNQDVTIKFAKLPMGVNTEPESPVIEHGAKEVEFTLRAASDAALGDFVAQIKDIRGLAPTRVDFKSVAESKPKDVVEATPHRWPERTSISEMRRLINSRRRTN